MATLLETTVTIPKIVLDHEAFEYTVLEDQRRILCTRQIGKMVDGAFRSYLVEQVTIEGEDYDTLLDSGSSPGRYWPEDVKRMHGEIHGRA
jgi:hypothetical protein